MGRIRLQQKGDLYKQGGLWRLRWRIDAIAEDGTTLRPWSKPVAIGPCEGQGRLTEKEARRLSWDNFLSRLDQNSRKPMSMMTVAQFVERKFLPEHVAVKKKAGRIHYASMLKHVLPALGRVRLQDATADDVQRLVSAKLREDYSVQTVTHIKNVVSAIFRHAEAKSWFSGVNPAKHVKLPEMVRKESHALTFEQCIALLGELRSPVREMVRTALLTSMNVAEMCGLQWKHINLTDRWSTVGGESLPPGCIAVRRQWYKSEYSTLKAGARKRYIPLTDDLLATYQVLSRRERFTGSDDPVFVSRNGTPVDEHNIANRTLKTVGAKLGMPWLSWHCFRHTHTTLADQTNMTMGDRVAMNGHAGMSMTSHYTHVDLERRRGILNLMAERLLPRTDGPLQ